MTRNGIGDYKTVPTRVVDEIVSSGYITEGDEYNLYYTVELPITVSSTGDVYFRGGRWRYTIADTGEDGEYWVKWNATSGSFMLDSGAVQPAASDLIKIGYTYDAPQEYSFRDSDLLRYIESAVYYVNKETCGITSYAVTGTPETSLTITAEPSAYVGRLISKVAQLEARLQIESESNTSAIYVKQGQVTIDTTKGGGDRLKSVKELKSEVRSMIKTIITGELDGKRIDLYSTYDDNHYDQGGYHEVNAGLGEEAGGIG